MIANKPIKLNIIAVTNIIVDSVITMEKPGRILPNLCIPCMQNFKTLIEQSSALLKAVLVYSAAKSCVELSCVPLVNQHMC